jgi:glycosyltransferase involved in cell wall biosynthesis
VTWAPGSSGRRRFVLTLLAWAEGLSGGDRHLLEVAARWRNEVEIVVVAPSAAAATVGEIAGDVAFRPLGSRPRLSRSVPATLAAEYVRRAVLAFRADLPPADVAVAGSHFLPDAAALTSLARRGAMGVAYVYHLVAGRERRDLRSLWSRNDERVALRLISRHAGLVFSSNSGTAAALRARGIETAHTRVGIDLSRLTPGAERRTANQAVFVARMTRTKGVVDAVKAWKQVVGVLPEARLVMAGDGPEREPGIRLAEQLAIGESIAWPGFVSEEAKRRLLRESRAFLAPSYEEGWGISVCEAMASGLPVVAYRLPTLDELFPDAYCASPVGDVDALTANVCSLLTDPVRALQYQGAGIETAAGYDIDRVAETELEVILSRLGSRA